MTPVDDLKNDFPPLHQNHELESNLELCWDQRAYSKHQEAKPGDFSPGKDNELKNHCKASN